MTPAQTQPSPTSFTLRASRMLAAMKALLITASDDPDRPHIAGVLFESIGKTLLMVSSDGHRLGLWEHALEDSGPKGKWFVPRLFVERFVDAIAQLQELERKGFLVRDEDDPMGQVMPQKLPSVSEGSEVYDPSISIDFESRTMTTALGSIRFALSRERFPSTWRDVIGDWSVARNQKKVDGIPAPLLDAAYVGDAVRCFDHAAFLAEGTAITTGVTLAAIPTRLPSLPATVHTGPVAIRSPEVPWFTYVVMTLRPGDESFELLWRYPLEESE